MKENEMLFREELVEELLNVSRLMREEKSLEKKIYYFSAAFGITGRTFRYVFSKDVLLADLVLNASYQSLNDRYQRMRSGDATVLIDEPVIPQIIDGLEMLAKNFERGEPIQEALETILTASYSITGPGNYLRDKGLLKLDLI